MPLKGKGFFTFRLDECEGGDPAAIVAAARAAGLSHVLVKIADGTQRFGLNSRGQDITAPVVKALKSAGIVVWGWHYVYGADPVAEAHTAVNRVVALGLDGYVIDAEAEYEQAGRDKAAHRFMNLLRNSLPHLPIALSSFRFPEYHPQFPWGVFLAKCDYHMPQVYWEQAHDAGAQLRESFKQCKALSNARPYIATGAAYGSGGWEPSADEVADFLAAARSLGIEAVNFFVWDYCRSNLLRVWAAIADAPWPGSVGRVPAPEPLPTPVPDNPPPPAPADFSSQYLSALNGRQAAAMAALYAPNAYMVRGDQAVQGPGPIQSSYSEFFAALSPGATFKVSGSEGEDELHFLSWVAGESAGQETLVLADGKIRAHFIYLRSEE